VGGTGCSSISVYCCRRRRDFGRYILTYTSTEMMVRTKRHAMPMPSQTDGGKLKGGEGETVGVGEVRWGMGFVL
jgi:hypothetical protein